MKNIENTENIICNTDSFLEAELAAEKHEAELISAIGAGSHEPTTSIKSARTVTDAPISIGDSYAGFERLCVSEKPDNAEADGENFIQMLAEIGGMKVTKLYNDDLHFIGYTMELKE